MLTEEHMRLPRRYGDDPRVAQWAGHSSPAAPQVRG